MRLYAVLLLAGGLLAPDATICAGVVPDPSHAAALPAEVVISNTRRIDFASQINGHQYSITVAIPLTPAPKGGYGVLYVLDGYWYFESAVEITRQASKPNVIVVGIGYPADESYDESVISQRGPLYSFLSDLSPSQSAPFLEREYDLSLPRTDAELAALHLPPAFKARNVGGVDDFLRTIETEVKPRVAALAPVDLHSQVLFGHSMGGFAALHALFVEPDVFRSFIIASPSIWWDERVLHDEKSFSETVASGRARPRVIVTVGGEESTPPNGRPGMVEDARDLVSRLKALRGAPGYIVDDCIVFDKFQHGPAAWAALARTIPLAFESAPQH